MKQVCRRAGGLLAIVAALVVVLLPARPAHAHSLDEYLQSTYVTVTPTGITVEFNLSIGVLLAPQVLQDLDPDRNEEITDAETSAYVETMLEQVTLTVDGVVLSLTLESIEPAPYLNVQAGYGLIEVVTSAIPEELSAGSHELSFVNEFTPSNARYQVNAFVTDRAAVELGMQRRDADQRRLDVTYELTGAVGEANTATSGSLTADSASTAGIGRLVDFLYDPSSTVVGFLVALGFAAVLGAFHALTPGHGKTLVAAYLVGDRGTMRHAVVLGAVVTFTHTVSVIGIGLLALFASHFVVPSVLVPTMQLLSGLLVVALGVRLLIRRIRARRNPTHAHHDHHHHEGDHHHEGRQHGHTHDHEHDHTHDHLMPAGGITPRTLVAMGVSGGLVPCPEALGILVIAVGLHRIVLGLGLIVSFSVGLAAVLIVIGLVLVRSRSLVERVGGVGERWVRVLPIVSAVVMIVLGLGIALQVRT